MIKAVLLDVDNTLLDFNKCAMAAAHAAARDVGLVLPENIYPVFRRINDRLWHQIEQRQLTTEELYRIRWQLIFDELGICADGVAFEALFRAHLDTSAEPVDGAAELLAYLHGKYILCIASNAPYDQQMQRLEKAGMLHYMSHLFVSEEIGAAKPSAAFFDACLSALSPLQPQEIMMIGDSLTADIAGARACGMRTCWYRHDGETARGEADCCVDALEEIRAVL